MKKLSFGLIIASVGFLTSSIDTVLDFNLDNVVKTTLWFIIVVLNMDINLKNLEIEKLKNSR